MTVEKCKDSGLALVLLCLFGYLLFPGPVPVLLAILFLTAAMTVPVVYRPFARLWFGLSSLLGTVMSRVLLSILFLSLVFPVAVARRALGKDAMQMRRWKKGKDSVFQVRNHVFSAKDLEHPY